MHWNVQFCITLLDLNLLTDMFSLGKEGVLPVRVRWLPVREGYNLWKLLSWSAETEILDKEFAAQA